MFPRKLRLSHNYSEVEWADYLPDAPRFCAKRKREFLANGRVVGDELRGSLDPFGRFVESSGAPERLDCRQIAAQTAKSFDGVAHANLSAALGTPAELQRVSEMLPRRRLRQSTCARMRSEQFSTSRLGCARRRSLTARGPRATRCSTSTREPAEPFAAFLNGSP